MCSDWPLRTEKKCSHNSRSWTDHIHLQYPSQLEWKLWRGIVFKSNARYSCCNDNIFVYLYVCCRDCFRLHSMHELASNALLLFVLLILIKTLKAINNDFLSLAITVASIFSCLPFILCISWVVFFGSLSLWYDYHKAGSVRIICDAIQIRTNGEWCNSQKAARCLCVRRKIEEKKDIKNFQLKWLV